VHFTTAVNTFHKSEQRERKRGDKRQTEDPKLIKQIGNAGHNTFVCSSAPSSPSFWLIPSSLLPFPSLMRFKGVTYKLVGNVFSQPSVPEKNKGQPHQLWLKRGKSVRCMLLVGCCISQSPCSICPLFPVCSVSPTVTSPHLLFVHLSYSSSFYCTMWMNVCFSFICKAIRGCCVISHFSKWCNL